MFNVAVVNGKEILKYLVSITVTLCLVMFVARYFSSLNNNESYQTEIDKKVSEVMQTSLLVCLDETIPVIKETNRELNNLDEDKIDESDILGGLLKIELAMFSQEQKIADIQNTASNQVQETVTNTKEDEKVEVARRCKCTNSNRKSIG